MRTPRPESTTRLANQVRRLAGSSVPWYVAAGWALDLFRGEQTREHHDIEIGVPAGRFPEIRERFPDFAFDAVGDGQMQPACPGGPRARQAHRNATPPLGTSERRYRGCTHRTRHREA